VGSTRIRATLWAILAVGTSLGAPLLGRQIAGAELHSALVFTPTVHDFGTVRGGMLVRTEYTYQNPTDKPIRVLGVTASCGCVHTQASTSYVEPGKSGTIRVAMMTEGRQGPQSFRIRVTTDEGPNGGARLFLKGEVRVALRPRPPRIVLGTVAPGSEHTVDLRVDRLEPTGEVMIKASGEGVAATKVAEDEKGLDLRVTVNVPWSRRSMRGGVRLQCDGGTTWIPVLWDMESPFELSATEIEMRGGKAELTAKPRWQGVTLGRIDTRGLPIQATRDGDRILLALKGSPFDVPSGAWIELIPDPATLGNVRVPVYVRQE
jgi:hypothetical protein